MFAVFTIPKILLPQSQRGNSFTPRHSYSLSISFIRFLPNKIQHLLLLSLLPSADHTQSRLIVVGPYLRLICRLWM